MERVTGGQQQLDFRVLKSLETKAGEFKTTITATAFYTETDISAVSSQHKWLCVAAGLQICCIGEEQFNHSEEDWTTITAGTLVSQKHCRGQ